MFHKDEQFSHVTNKNCIVRKQNFKKICTDVTPSHLGKGHGLGDCN